ncbi:MAG: hypothetical protein U0230_19835 [Polyangiales bacterium]
MNTIVRKLAPLLVATLFGSLVVASQAEAQGRRATAEVFIVLAKEQPGQVDPELADMPALRRPPFNSFRSLQVLSKPRLSLTEGQDSDLELPNGRRLRIRLMQVTEDGRFHLKVSINRPDQADYLPLLQVVASPGDPFFVGGQVYQDGTLILGIRVRP